MPVVAKLLEHQPEPLVAKSPLHSMVMRRSESELSTPWSLYHDVRVLFRHFLLIFFHDYRQILAIKSDIMLPVVWPLKLHASPVFSFIMTILNIAPVKKKNLNFLICEIQQSPYC